MRLAGSSLTTALRRRHAGMATLLLATSLSVAADPFAAGTMAVFEANGPREVDLAPEAAPTLTVFTADGPREVAIATTWPEVQGGGYLKLSSGYRHDKLRYNIPGDGINIVSELTWQVPAAEIRLDGGWTHTSGFTVKGHLAYAQTVSGGEVQDSDYFLNDRQGEFSRSYSKPQDSRMIDISLGAGWNLPLGRGGSLTPMFGLARYESLYRMRDGRQAISDYGLSMPLGSFPGLDSKYNPVWSSVWQGFEAEFKPFTRFALRAAVKHHWFDYRAEADWNLRNDRAHPVSFVHEGHGRGWESELGVDWRVFRAHRLTLDLSGRKFELKDGKRTVYAAAGGSVETSLNEVIADSWSARLGYRYEY